MSSIVTIQQVGLIVDLIYHNQSRSDKKPVSLLYKEAGTSINTFFKVRSILIDMDLLVIVGERRNQTSYWNPNRSQPTPSMLQEVYRRYTKDYKVRVKEIKKQRGKISLQEALKVLTSMGYSGVISRKKCDGYITMIEEIDLDKVGD